LVLLRDGFRHVSWIASAAEDQFIEDGSVREEYGEDDHFVGQDGTALYLHFEFHAICMRITKSSLIEFIRNFTIYLSMV
jgi:hypothetical protein